MAIITNRFCPKCMHNDNHKLQINRHKKIMPQDVVCPQCGRYFYYTQLISKFKVFLHKLKGYINKDKHHG